MYDENISKTNRFIYKNDENGNLTEYCWAKWFAYLENSGYYYDNLADCYYDYEVIGDYHLVKASDSNSVFKVVKKLDTYTYLPLQRTKLSAMTAYTYNEGKMVIRERNIYYVDENKKFMKYDFIADQGMEIKTDGYTINAVSEDKAGNIVLEGFDQSTFKEFIGYLDENDSVTFTPVIDNGGYDVIYMNPIN